MDVIRSRTSTYKLEYLQVVQGIAVVDLREINPRREGKVPRDVEFRHEGDSGQRRCQYDWSSICRARFNSSDTFHDV